MRLDLNLSASLQKSPAAVVNMVQDVEEDIEKCKEMVSAEICDSADRMQPTNERTPRQRRNQKLKSDSELLNIRMR